jgi:flagellar M-ring protein FliF
MNALLASLQRLKDTFLALPRTQKVLYGSSILMVAASLMYLAYFTNQVDYVPLFSRLSESDMAAIVETLKKKKTPYLLTDSGTVSVPKEQLYDIRLSLAAEGIPKGAGAGFEIFDQQKLGSTEFVQKINYQRALQGELARTINQMNEVMESRVHLVIPEESLFLEDRKPSSAAVVLKLHPGVRLSQRQIQGIVNLVSSSVKGLEDDKVTILSTDGQVIFKKNSKDNALQSTSTHLEYKNQVEENLRQKVQAMLEQVLGSSRVISRVTADLDFNQTNVEQETYDPDSAVVRSHQRSIENNEGPNPTPRGNPDTPINLESKLMEGQQAKDQQQKKFNRQRETVNYEMNHVNRKIVHAPGTVKKLSVAVVVDGLYETKPDASGQPKLVFVGRSPEQLKSFEDIVKKAVGYDEARNDQITVSNAPFSTELPGMNDVSPSNWWLETLKSNQRVIINVLLLLFVFFFLVRPIMKRLQKLPKTNPVLAPPQRPAALPAGTSSGPSLFETPESSSESIPSLRDNVVSFVERDPDKAREILRMWLREGS